MPQKQTSSFEEERNRFERQFEHIKNNHKPFGEQVIELLETKKLTTGKEFTDATLLNANILSRLKNAPSGKFEFSTVIAICVGLDLDVQRSEHLLASAGLAFRPLKRTHQAYRHVIANLPGMDIDSRNQFLTFAGVESLGSKEYKK